MYVHVGGETLVPLQDVIAILDAQAGRMTAESRRLVRDALAGGRYRDVSSGTVNAYIVTDTCVYASPISAGTLKKRIESGRHGLPLFDMSDEEGVK